MTGLDKVYEVVKKLNKEQFDVNIFGKRCSDGAYLEVYNTDTKAKINFEFDAKGDLVDIWAEKDC